MIQLSKKAAFLDRDGTLIEDKGYMNSPDQVTLLPGVITALQKLKSMGFELVVISNQSGIGRGLITPDQVNAINAKLLSMLQPYGIGFLGFYICPHHPDELCCCRKPKPGLILRALSDLNINKECSYMVGDKWSDAEAGLAAGVTPVLISNNAPVKCISNVSVFDSLLDFVDFIIRTDDN